MFFIEEFLLKAQHHSRLPWSNAICIDHLVWLSACVDNNCLTGPSLEDAIESTLNEYMIEAHENYHKNKTWKSYDW